MSPNLETRTDSSIEMSGISTTRSVSQSVHTEGTSGTAGTAKGAGIRTTQTCSPEFGSIETQGSSTHAQGPKLRIGLVRKLCDSLLGISREYPSVGGRRLPLCTNPARVSSNYATVKALDGQTLLVDERKGMPYLDNTITSSKYTLLSFLPRQLFAQFSKLANCYFMIIAILQMIPSWSTTGTYTTIIPLLVFISISIIREGYDDIRRHRLDRQENEHIATVICEDEVGQIGRDQIGQDQIGQSNHGSSLTRLRADTVNSTTRLCADTVSSTSGLHADTVSSVDSDRPGVNSFTKKAALRSTDLTTKKVQWRNIRVGNIIKLECDEWVPADMILLTSTSDLGETFVETMALDGETNLKSRLPVVDVHRAANTARGLYGLDATILSEDPNLDLYNYEGSLLMTDPVTGESTKYPLGPSNIMYRGSIVRNTKSCLGLVVFTGEETKIRMNAIKRPRIKAPKLQRAINLIVIFMVFVVLFCACFAFMGEHILYNRYKNLTWYTYQEDAGVAATLVGFIIMFNTMIPLSLYVTMEIIKIMQMILLQWDIDMYDSASNTPAEARTATILEELGQVSYIFSDKTGTLTDNLMIFRRFSVMGTSWEQGDPDPPMEDMASGSITFSGRPSICSLTSQDRDQSDKIRSSTDLIEYIQQNPTTDFAKKVSFFFLSIALCHTCLPKPNSEKIEYQASSPDELALVHAASDMGYIFMSRKLGKVIIKTFPQGFDKAPVLEEYQVLDVVEFTSARKRMSVIVRFPDGKIRMICKGADNVLLGMLTASGAVFNQQEKLSVELSSRHRAEVDAVLSRRSMASSKRTSGLSARSRVLKRTTTAMSIDTSTPPRTPAPLESLPTEAELNSDEFLIGRTLKHLDKFATDGLRTLMYAYRDISEEQYAEWSRTYAAAKTAVENRGEKVEQVGGQLEEKFTLLGCTAIEDKLQEGVPDTIEKLRRAGMKMWMLTGDKRETAINIGHACRLIKEYSTVVVLSKDTNSMAELGSIMNAAEIEIDEGNVAHCVVVIDGATLSEMEEDMTILSVFVSLGVKADSVICCRASPSQKASLVGRVRSHHKGKVTLAIGDGANDISMILNADVGIGVTGREGLQAARASDYSIARFRFLQKLLLVHGRYNYVRTSKFVLCTFYKELMFYLSQLIYQRQTMFTGSSLYESWSLSMFNTLFTSLPVLFIGMFDQDLAPATLIAVPELYSMGREGKMFNLPIFVKWMLLAAAQSVTLSFSEWYVWGFGATIDNTTYPLGCALYTAFLILINTKISFVETHNLTKMSGISWIISVGGWGIFCVLLIGLYGSKNESIFYVHEGLLHTFGHDYTYWFVIFALTIIALFMDLMVHVLRLFLAPNDTDIFQQLEKKPAIQEKLELCAYSELKQGWCWEHESMIKEENLENWSPQRRRLHYIKSFLRKGSIHTSKATRKRASTMVSPTELPPDSPSVVALASSDRYDVEMLPSGHVIRKKAVKDETIDEEAIDEILVHRMEVAEEDE